MVAVLGMKNVMVNIGGLRGDATITISWLPGRGDSIPSRIRVDGVELEPRCLSCQVVFRHAGAACRHGLELKQDVRDLRVRAGREAAVIIAWVPV